MDWRPPNGCRTAGTAKPESGDAAGGRTSCVRSKHRKGRFRTDLLERRQSSEKALAEMQAAGSVTRKVQKANNGLSWAGGREGLRTRQRRWVAGWRRDWSPARAEARNSAAARRRSGDLNEWVSATPGPGQRPGLRATKPGITPAPHIRRRCGRAGPVTPARQCGAGSQRGSQPPAQAALRPRPRCSLASWGCIENAALTWKESQYESSQRAFSSTRCAFGR